MPKEKSFEIPNRGAFCGNSLSDAERAKSTQIHSKTAHNRTEFRGK